MPNCVDTELSNHLPYATVISNHKMLCTLLSDFETSPQQAVTFVPVSSESDIQHVLITIVLNRTTKLHTISLSSAQYYSIWFVILGTQVLNTLKTSFHLKIAQLIHFIVSLHFISS